MASMKDSILQLGRWPSLEEVQLKGCVIREDTLEELHARAPQLVVWHGACEAKVGPQAGA